jgi:hypothetical protein
MEITFEIGNENRPQIEKIDEKSIKESIFSEQYQYALKALNNYMSVVSPNGTRHYRNEEERFSSLTDANNNIFAFIGDRGSGKTSCMMSLAAFLDKPNNEILLEYPELKKHSNFYALDPIDPSFFDKDHNILFIILAKLFAKYKEEKKSGKKEIVNCYELELIRLFNDTQRDLAYITEKPNPDNDNLRQLESLSAAVDLKDDIKKLVKMFFECFKMGSDTTLLLVIDDIDLNTTEAEIMAEQIRKYFVQQGIVILMALKLDQFEMVKRLSLAKEYKVLLDKVIHMSDLDEMMERYLTKFLPHNQRIYMPDSEYYMNSKLKITKNAEPNSYPSIKQAVPQLIFQKTRYLFYNSPQHVSYIVPRNLRELRQLISLLYEMDDYGVNDDGMPKYNKTLFKKYLFDNWTMNNLNIDDKKRIDELVAVDDMSLFNDHALKILQTRFPDNFKIVEVTKDSSDEEREEFYLKKTTNMFYNISSGDILSLMDMFERQHINQEDQHFLFILRSLYSMRLYEAYDKVTENESAIDNTHNDSLEIVMRNDQFNGLSEYDKLVGGRFVNSRMTEFLPKDSDKRSRTNRQINILELNSLIEKCVDNWEETPSRTKQMVEFFMLCIARDFSTQNKKNNIDFYDPSYRTRRNVNYSMSLESNKNAFFDINSFMFNVTRIEKCYKRFSKGKEFFEKANKDEETLWRKFKLFIVTNNKTDIPKDSPEIEKYYYRRWLSLCSLRNAEIIQDLYLFLENIEYKGGDDTNILYQYFKGLGEYSIQTYDRTPGGKNFYLIRYPFAKDIAECLKSLNNSDKKDFQKIYSELKNRSKKNVDSTTQKKHKEKDKEEIKDINNIIEDGESQADTESSISEEDNPTKS